MWYITISRRPTLYYIYITKVWGLGPGILYYIFTCMLNPSIPAALKSVIISSASSVKPSGLVLQLQLCLLLPVEVGYIN